MGFISNIRGFLARTPEKQNINNILGKHKRASYKVNPRPSPPISYEINDIKSAISIANSDSKDRSRLLAIYEYIEQDSHLHSQILIATNKIISEPFLLYRGDKPSPEITRLLQKKWFENVVTSIIEAEFWGFTLVEFDVSVEGIITVKQIPRICVNPDLQILLFDGTQSGPQLNYADLMEELYLMQFGKERDLGSFRKAAFNILWKYYARSDWSRASEKWGMPILHIEADTNVDSEIDNLEQKAANFGSDGYIITQHGDSVNIIERSGQDIHGIYLENIKYCDDQVSKLINGQTSSSDHKAWAGAAGVQERILEDISVARMRRVKYAMNTDVLPFLIRKGVKDLEGYEFDYPLLRDIQSETPVKFEINPPTTDQKKKELSRQILPLDTIHQLYFGHHQSCGCNEHKTTPKQFTTSRKSIINEALTEIFDKPEEVINQSLFELYYKQFSKKLNQVYLPGKNDDLKRYFDGNLREFAAYKTNQLTTAIIATNGNRTKASEYALRHNRYATAEANTITARARTARQWEIFQNEREYFPNLTWIMTRSATPRELHLSYVGVVLPIDDPFWLNNQPGNLWNCKCDWKTTNEPITGNPAETVQPALGLDGNPCNTGKLITFNHPYFDSEQSEAVNAFTRSITRANALEKATSKLLKIQEEFTINDITKKIIHTKKSLSHLVSSGGSDEIIVRILMVPNINDIIKKSKYSGTYPDKKSNPMVLNYHRLKYFDGIKNWEIIVREIADAFRIYAISDSI